jgi:hypothetical protein
LIKLEGPAHGQRFAGRFAAGLDVCDEIAFDAVRDGARSRLPDGPFGLDARAWFARGTVPR